MTIDYSIVIPAYNEAAWLPQTLAAIHQAMVDVPMSGEIIVCDNNSTDATTQIAESLGAQVVFESYNQISRARNTGAAAARGRYLIFVDADTLISSALLLETLHQLHDGCCRSGGSIVKADCDMSKPAQLGLNFWNGLSVKLGLAAGCYMFCSREDFEVIGGFSESVYASEEIWMSRALKKIAKQNAQRFCILTQSPVVSSGRKLQWFSTSRQLLLVMMLFLFPFLVRFKRFCGFWYNRP